MLRKLLLRWLETRWIKPKRRRWTVVGSYAALFSEPSLKVEGEVSNSRMGM